MKKFLSLILCTVIACSYVFTGCGASNSPKATEEGKESKPVLKVGMECAYAPYNWTQTDDSNGAVPISGTGSFAYGYDVMMAKLLAEKLGYELEIVKSDWDGLPMAVSSGKIDAAICGMSITSERKQSVDFTSPYYYASVVGLTRKDTPFVEAKTIQDLKGASCTSQMGTIWYQLLSKIPEAKVLPAISDVPAMLVALTSGKADLLVSDMPTCMAAVSTDPNLVLLDFNNENVFEASQEDIEIGIAIKKGNTELAEKMNSVLDLLTEEDRAKMMEEAIAKQPLATK